MKLFEIDKGGWLLSTSLNIMFPVAWSNEKYLITSPNCLNPSLSSPRIDPRHSKTFESVTGLVAALQRPVTDLNFASIDIFF